MKNPVSAITEEKKIKLSIVLKNLIYSLEVFHSAASSPVFPKMK